MITRNTAFRVSSLALAIGLSFTASADEIARDPLLNVNEVIVVHGEGADAEQLATTHWSIDEAEIRALGAQTLDQVLKNVPGFISVWVAMALLGSISVVLRPAMSLCW